MKYAIYHIWSYENLGSTLYKIPPNKKIIVAAAEEMEINPDFNPKKLPRQKEINWIFCADRPAHKVYKKLPSSNIFYWDNFFLYYSVSGLELPSQKKIDKQKKKDSVFLISLNGQPHWHRCLMLDKLEKNNLIKNNYISWHNPPDNDVHFDWSFFDNRKLIVDKNYAKQPDSQRLPIQFFNSFINLVAESTHDVRFITEKTWNPIMIQKPFIVFGAPGFHKKLEKMGIELYTEIIDYSFDEEEDVEKRLDLIIEQLVHLQYKDWNMLLSKIKHKLISNQQKCIDIIVNQQNVPRIVNHIDLYQEVIRSAKERSSILAKYNLVPDLKSNTALN